MTVILLVYCFTLFFILESDSQSKHDENEDISIIVTARSIEDLMDHL